MIISNDSNDDGLQKPSTMKMTECDNLCLVSFVKMTRMIRRKVGERGIGKDKRMSKS